LKKTKRTGFLTKVVITVILIALIISLIHVGTRLAAAQTARDALQAQVDEQTQENAALQENIDNSSDPDVVLEVAKQRLGLVDRDEVIFYDTTN
jgi:cell division protein FtsL